MSELIFKNSNELTSQEIEDMYQLNVRMYPAFTDIYEKNRYYSYCRPEMVLMAYKDGNLVADANFSWREIELENGKISFSFFGILIDENHQQRGLGTKIVKTFIEKARDRSYSFVLCSTKNELLGKPLMEGGFIKLNTKVYWQDLATNERTQMNSNEAGYHAYALPLENEALSFLRSAAELFLGDGPI